MNANLVTPVYWVLLLVCGGMLLALHHNLDRFSQRHLQNCLQKRISQREQIEAHLQTAKDNLALVQRLHTRRVVILSTDTIKRMQQQISNAQAAFDLDDYDKALKLSKEVAKHSNVSCIFSLHQNTNIERQ
jgi:hypothetical protein